MVRPTSSEQVRISATMHARPLMALCLAQANSLIRATMLTLRICKNAVPHFHTPRCGLCPVLRTAHICGGSDYVSGAANRAPLGRIGIVPTPLFAFPPLALRRHAFSRFPLA